MERVLAAEAAVLFQFELFRGVLFVLAGVVVTLLAFVAPENNFDAHIGTSNYCLPVLDWQISGLSVCENQFERTK